VATKASLFKARFPHPLSATFVLHAVMARQDCQNFVLVRFQACICSFLQVLLLPSMCGTCLKSRRAHQGVYFWKVGALFACNRDLSCCCIVGNSRRGEERRKRREKEARDDEIDREIEAEKQLAELKRQQEEEEAAAAAGALSAMVSSGPFRHPIVCAARGSSFANWWCPCRMCGQSPSGSSRQLA
jgi:hypothetical protein